MKKSLKITALCVCTFLLGMTFNNQVQSLPANLKVAVVDVQKVIQSWSQLKALNTQREKDVNALTQFVNKARTEVAAEKDAKKKKALEDKYNAELNARRNKINKDYSTKLAAIDKSLATTITAKAKAGKYDFVFKKDAVLFGGDDLTSVVQQAVK